MFLDSKLRTNPAFAALSQYLCSPVVSLTQTTARLFHPPMSIRGRKFLRPRSRIFCCISLDNHSFQGFPELCGIWPFRNEPVTKFLAGRPSIPISTFDIFVSRKMICKPDCPDRSVIRKRYKLSICPTNPSKRIWRNRGILVRSMVCFLLPYNCIYSCSILGTNAASGHPSEQKLTRTKIE